MSLNIYLTCSTVAIKANKANDRFFYLLFFIKRLNNGEHQSFFYKKIKERKKTARNRKLNIAEGNSWIAKQTQEELS